MQDNNYHVRVLIPCYKEPYEIVLRTVNAIRDAVLPAGALHYHFLCVWIHTCKWASVGLRLAV